MYYFSRLDTLDVELQDRLAQWFSFHLANFSYQWPWKSWFVLTLALAPLSHSLIVLDQYVQAAELACCPA